MEQKLKIWPVKYGAAYGERQTEKADERTMNHKTSQPDRQTEWLRNGPDWQTNWQSDRQTGRQRKQKKEETERARICTDVCSVSHRMWQTVLRYTSACRDDTWVEPLCRLRFCSSVTRWLMLQGGRHWRHLHIHLFLKMGCMFTSIKNGHID